MGLDMYLVRRTYMKRWNNDPSRKFKVSITYGGVPYTGINPELITHIDEEVGYWRKANAIHAWFVRHVQRGKDDCEEYYVDEADLRNLIFAVNLALSSDVEAAIVLPTEEGFFFGSTDYGEHYRHHLEHTKKMIEPLIARGHDTNVAYYYRASW